MTEISSRYNPAETEDKWYKYWLDNGFFNSEPDNREPYCIVIPPPNVTGVLHMGHMLNNTIQDILVRRARMQEKNACWVPGTDHASIATEAKVVEKLKNEGLKNHHSHANSSSSTLGSGRETWRNYSRTVKEIGSFVRLAKNKIYYGRAFVAERFKGFCRFI